MPIKPTTEIAGMKPTIVIIEDDKAARHSLRMVLEAFGHQVEDYATAEELAARGPLDVTNLLILDVNLPGASGLETLEQLRAIGLSVPAVLVSGRATAEMRSQAKRLNALAFFDKPIDIDGLLNAIGSVSS